MCLQTPQPASPQAVTQQTLAAEISAAPGQFNANATYSPLYSQLALNNMSNYLNGSPATSVDYAAVGTPGKKGYIAGGTTNVPGSPGFLSLYQNSILPALDQANSTIKQSNINDATTLAPQIIAGERAANPGGAALLDSATNQAQQRLDLNGALDPFTKRMLEQDVRSGQAARGMGTGENDAAQEAYYQDATRYQRQQAAQGTALQTAGADEQFYGNPMAVLSGMGSNAGMTAGGAAGAAASGVAPANSPMFDPQSALALQTGAQRFDSSVAGANNQNMWLTAPTSYAENA